MFDHVNCVVGWTIMACHVYDLLYCKGLTIVVCDMQFEDTETQQLMWTKLNQTMLKYMFPKSNFQGFMVDNAQANWNVVIIVYGLGDPFIRMVDKEHICLFHWIQSFDKHTKQLIRPKLQDEHKVLCHEYKNATSFGDVDNHYVLICSWWLSFGVAFEASVHKLSNWLNFWHFRVKQWGVYVSTSSVNFL